MKYILKVHGLTEPEWRTNAQLSVQKSEIRKLLFIISALSWNPLAILLGSVQYIISDVSKWDYKEMLQTKSCLSCLSNLCQPERQTRSSREAKVNVCPCLPCQWKRMPLIMRGDKWLSGANLKLNKWLLRLFAQGFLHNKAEWEDVCSILKMLQPYFALTLPLTVWLKCGNKEPKFFGSESGSNNKIWPLICSDLSV